MNRAFVAVCASRRQLLSSRKLARHCYHRIERHLGVAGARQLSTNTSDQFLPATIERSDVAAATEQQNDAVVSTAVAVTPRHAEEFKIIRALTKRNKTTRQMHKAAELLLANVLCPETMVTPAFCVVASHPALLCDFVSGR